MKSSIPQIVLTGSSGFLGQHLLNSLVQHPLLLDQELGCHIHALFGGHMEGFAQAVEEIVNKSQNKNKIKVQVHPLDLTHSDQVQAWISTYATNLDLCIHMAALSSPRTCQEAPDRARALNVPKAFFKGLVEQNVPIVALSTDQVYDGTQKAPYTEQDQVNPVNIYGTTKVEMEQCLKTLSKEHNIAAILLRSSIILGPKAPILPDQAHATFLHFCQGRQGQTTEFYSDECRSVIAVDNVVTVIRWFSVQILQQGEGFSSQQQQQQQQQVYNMGGPEKVSRVDMAEAVFEHFGFAKDSLVALEKAKLPPPTQGVVVVASPLDITMDSSKLYQVVKDISWKALNEMVQLTFSSTSTS